MKNSVKDLTKLGMLITVALLVSYLETFLPLPFGVPGMKLGFANVIVIVVLYQEGGRKAWLVNMLRIVLLSAFFGNLSMAFYSLAGGVVSLLCMWLGKKYALAVVTVSVIGGIAHNAGQLLAAILVLQTVSLFYYAPVLFLCGAFTGAVVGVVAERLLRLRRF